MPRCRTCPVRLAAEIRDLIPCEPEHLAGLPACLHKYEPLFRDPTPEDAGVEARP
jgi:hypothetical protein